MLVTTPDWLNFSIWAEDACVVVQDGKGGRSYIVEPFEFSRYGDQTVAELVAHSTSSIETTQVPLIFQGGNVLIGDTFVLIGRDYLDRSIAVADARQTPFEDFPRNGAAGDKEHFIRDMFRRTLDPGRDIHFLESTPRDRPGNELVDIDGKQWVSIVDGGRGERQPIFHIDMFVSLAGRGSDGRYRVLVGDPSMADELMSWTPQDHELQEEFDEIAVQLEGLGFDVRRTPLPVVDQVIAGSRTIDTAKGPVAVEGDLIWYHATSNNCLVQIDGDAHDVWLPTYGHDPAPALKKIDDEHVKIWTELGFNVHTLGNFHPFAQAQGALHCIKKYLER